MALLPFAQLDFAGEVPVEDGRYVCRPPGEPDAEPDVLALKTLGSEVAKRGLRRRGRSQPAADPGRVPAIKVSRLTFVKARPFGAEADAAQWLEEVARRQELAESLAMEAARSLNRAIRAHRVAAADPYAADLHPGSAIEIRFGYGTGDEVAEGRWSEARVMPEGGRQRLLERARTEAGPQERVAAVLGGREEVAPHEELLVAARRALSERRLAEAGVLCEAAARSIARLGAGHSEGVDWAARAAELLDEPERRPPGEEELRELIVGLGGAGGRKE